VKEMKRTYIIPAIAAVAAYLTPGIAKADAGISDVGESANTMANIMPAEDVFDEEVSTDIVSDEVLSEQRGGFVIGGMNISLGAQMRTYLNGVLVLETSVNWTDMGATTTQTVSGALSQANMAALRAGFASGGAVSLKVGEAPVYLANEGQTALIQRTDNGVQNILINSASNVNLTQQTDITLGLQGYAGFSQDLLTSRITDSLNNALGAATFGALGR
jgi:hypothetical protein